MKNFTIFILILFFFQSNAQIDRNWYVLENEHLNSSGTFGAPSVNLDNSCYVKKVAHPYRTSTYFNEGGARNDIFIIFADGKHFNSKGLDRTVWKDGIPNAGSSIDSNYYIWTDQTIEYLYYTNVYEGDEEPDAYIDPVDPPGNPMSYYDFNVNGNNQLRASMTTPDNAITVNHTPVPGKDITLILTHEYLNPNCNYKLCYDIEFQNSTSLGSTPPLLITESKIFPLNSFIVSGGSGMNPITNSINNKCIENLTFNSGSFTYINLAIPDDPDDLISSSPLHFNLTSDDPVHCAPIAAFTDTIRDSHDPNYIEVLCVNKPPKDTMSTIKYRAQCMNDGNATQANPSIEFTFPFNVSLSDISITNSSIALIAPFIDFNHQAPYLSAPATNRIKFQFFGVLDFCPIDSEREGCKAWVEFCVKVKNADVDVLLDDLRPFNRNTNFGDTAYPIIRFIDLECAPCEISEPDPRGDPNDGGNSNEKDTVKGKQNISNSSTSKEAFVLDKTTKCCRTSSNCDCISELPRCSWYSIVCNNKIKWHKLIFCLSILYLLLFFSRRRRKSKG